MSTTERRKTRRAHRKAARQLMRGGTMFNSYAPVGSTPWMVAQWHFQKARRA